MKFLFVMSHPGYVRNNEPTLRVLANRGHRVVLGFNRRRRDPNDRLAEELASTHSTIILQYLPNRNDWWAPMANFVRGSMDYLRYFDPGFDDAEALRERIAQKLPAFTRSCFNRAGLRDHPERRRLLHRALAALEWIIPTAGPIDRVLAEESPDAVIVTPLVDFNSKQTDWVKSAKALGIPTCLAVFSWDNLTNKGHMRVLPDRVTVWNEPQAEEAMRFHSVPRERISVTGAQCYDKWFGRGSRSRPPDLSEPNGVGP